MLIQKTEGTPYKLRGEMHTPIIVRVIRQCDCQQKRDVGYCYMCGRCPDHCPCRHPFIVRP